jgi:hypothetical protein
MILKSWVHFPQEDLWVWKLSKNHRMEENLPKFSLEATAGDRFGEE